MNTNRIHVFAVDDSETFLRGIESILSLEEDMVLMGKAHIGQDAMRQIVALHPAIVLMDLRLRWTEEADRPSQEDGIKTIGEISHRWPEARIIVISSFSERRWVVRAMNAGAQGYLAKEASAEQVIAAIRTIKGGGVVLTAKQLAWLRELVEPFTPREMEVLALLSEGKSDMEIAQKLYIAPRTASKHVENIREKLGVSSRWEAVAIARRKGLI